MELSHQNHEAFEKILSFENLSKKSTNAVRSQFSSLLSKIFETENDLNFILENTQSFDKKIFLAISFLRLLLEDKDLIWDINDKQLRLSIFKLFDEIFKDNIYTICKIDTKDDNVLKLDKLSKYKKLIEEPFFSLINIDDVSKQRERMLKLLNNKYFRIFYEEVVFDKLIINKEYINNIYQLVIDYFESDISSKILSYKKVENNISKTISSCKIEFNHLLNNTFSEIFVNLFAKVKDDFEKSDYKKDFETRISDSGRKYPFHIINNEFEIVLNVENKGPGLALDVNIEIQSDDINFLSPRYYLGHLKVGVSEVRFKCYISKELKTNPVCLIKLTCKDFYSKVKENEELLQFLSQNKDINWESIESKVPYSLEAVEYENQLAGRTGLLKSMLPKFQSEKPESSIISGQKRVGKTSLANIIYSKLEKDGYIVAFTKTGDLNKITPERSISSLGYKIAKEIIDKCELPPNFNVPEFEDALDPLIDFLKDVHKVKKEKKIIIIIDEFDELQYDLLKDSTPIGDTFLQNLRSISELKFVGVLLIGAENMQFVKEDTTRLNKFDSYFVDYFDKQNYWKDFQDLVKNPVIDYKIEYEDKAIEKLFDYTDGNPFFTKMICRRIFKKCCERRNSYITDYDVVEAIHKTVNEIDVQHINHFWVDGIRVKDKAKKDQIETARRRFLVTFADLFRKSPNISIPDFQKYIESKTLDFNIIEIMESFKNRNILVELENKYRLKPRLFEEWLIDKGVSVLRKGFSDEDSVKVLIQKEEELYIKDTELVDLVGNWPAYNNTQLNEIQLRAWIEQFETLEERRIVFELIKNIKFYSDATTREKLSIIHKYVMDRTITSVSGREKVLRNILLSCFDTTKSSSIYMRLYANQNQIQSENISNYDNISKKITRNDRVNTLVFVDDIIGTGNTQIDNLKRITNDYASIIIERDIKVFFTAICGFDSAIKRLKDECESVQFKTEVYVADSLNDSDKIFSDSSFVFLNNPHLDLNKTKHIINKYGLRLEKKHPLGYNDSQLLIVFSHNCPNNSLPILWKKENKVNNAWKALFERQFLIETY